ncbi:uncharacterized protein LOC118149687 [Callithrix jacchus]
MPSEHWTTIACPWLSARCQQNTFQDPQQRRQRNPHRLQFSRGRQNITAAETIPFLLLTTLTECSGSVYLTPLDFIIYLEKFYKEGKDFESTGDYHRYSQWHLPKGFESFASTRGKAPVRVKIQFQTGATSILKVSRSCAYDVFTSVLETKKTERLEGRTQQFTGTARCKNPEPSKPAPAEERGPGS